MIYPKYRLGSEFNSVDGIALLILQLYRDLDTLQVAANELLPAIKVKAKKAIETLNQFAGKHGEVIGLFRHQCGFMLSFPQWK